MRPGSKSEVGTWGEAERGVPYNAHVGCMHQAPPTLVSMSAAKFLIWLQGRST